MRTWPTPLASDWNNMDTAKQKSLASEVKLFPTPTARDWKDRGKNTNYEKAKEKRRLAGAVGGQLNPPFVEWLMGYPIGWTELED